MMIELAHKIIQDQIRKYNGAYRTPEQIDRALYRGLLDYYSLLFKSTDNIQRLHRYLKSVDHNSIGTFTLPEDFQKESNIFSLFQGSEWEGDILTDQEFGDRVNSFILSPEYKRPIARIRNRSIEYLPADGNYKFTYYRNPAEPKFAYTVDGRNIVFNEADSVDIDVDKSSLNKVLINSLAYLGIALKDESLLTEKQLGN